MEFMFSGKFFQLLIAFVADYVFYLAGIVSSYLMIYAQHLFKELGDYNMALVNGFSLCLALFGKHYLTARFNGDEAIVLEDIHCTADAWL